jgi:hypothetical protein
MRPEPLIRLRSRKCRSTHRAGLARRLGMAQQPLGATRFGILGQAAHGQLGLLPVRLRDVMQHRQRRRWQGVEARLKGGQRDPAQGDSRFGNSVDRTGQTQNSRRSLKPERTFDHPELMNQQVAFHQAQRHATGIHMQNLPHRHGTPQYRRSWRKGLDLGTSIK